MNIMSKLIKNFKNKQNKSEVKERTNINNNKKLIFWFVNKKKYNKIIKLK